LEQWGYTNTIKLAGTLYEPLRHSHKVYGEDFYKGSICVPRLSGQVDLLPITMGGRLLMGGMPNVGDALTLIGQLRSYNQRVGERSRLILTAFIKDVIPGETGDECMNFVSLTGCVVKPPIYRHTPLNREITDVLLAVNRPFYKSDYIPCIAWGRIARELQDYPVGEKLAVRGRFQSRIYEKQQPDGTGLAKTAYEVSIMSIEKG